MKAITRYRDRVRQLKTDDAGITPAQMIIGLIALVILTGISVMLYMNLVPWFQNGATENETNSVAQAQESYYGMYGVDRREGDGSRYAPLSELKSTQLLDANDSTWDSSNAAVRLPGDGVNSGWEVVIRSSSQDVIYANDVMSDTCNLGDVDLPFSDGSTSAAGSYLATNMDECIAAGGR